MNRVERLREDVVDGSTDLSTVLRQAQVLATELGSPELREWTKRELEGYATIDDLPPYRIAPAASVGTFINQFGDQMRNVPIPLSVLPEELHEHVGRIYFAHGVAHLQSLADGATDGSLTESWPAEAAAFLSNRIYEGYNCMSARKVVPSSFVEGILSTVRNRLLDFLNELTERHPQVQAEEGVPQPPSEEELRSIVYQTIIVGDHNVASSGQDIQQTVSTGLAPGDLEALLRYMREQVGLPEETVDELCTAIEADKSVGGFGGRVKEWLGETMQKIATGTIVSACKNAPTLITEAIKKYFGMM